MQVPLFEGYDSGTTDFAPFINKIPAGVDAVMGGGHFADTTTFARQLYEKKVPTKMIALLVAPPEPKFAELGEACISVIGSSQWEPLAKYSPEAAKAEKVEWFGPTVPDFIKLYQAKYGKEEPSYHSAGGYAAGLILQKAIEKAGSTDTDKGQGRPGQGRHVHLLRPHQVQHDPQAPRPPGRPRDDLHPVAEG